MAIIFTKQKKSQRNLIIASIFVIILSLIVFWQGFFREETPYVSPEVLLPPSREISINFEALEKIKEFQPFAKIEPFKEVPPTEDKPAGVKIGRENPFLPY